MDLRRIREIRQRAGRAGNRGGGVVVKKLGHGIKAHAAGIERQHNHSCVIFAVKVLDYLDVATEHTDTDI